MRWLIICFLCLLSAWSTAREDTTHIPQDIAELFPTATRIGEIDNSLTVVPVYQLQELLGYSFQSIDFANFIGFAGKPINLLIGLDTEGNFVGFKVLQHNEPIFLHGLGEQSMFDFIDQFIGHNVRERYIIGGDKNSGSDATYFDGVTKATVSVLVINDTIVTSALAVARAKLSGFVAPTNKMVDPDFFEPLSFEQLLDRELIHRQRVTADELQQLPSEIQSAAAPHIAEEGVFADMYYAFASIPVVGKNLLGDAEYKRLMSQLEPGELALMLMSTEGFSFISDEFIPQTVPEFFRISQAEFPLDARDLDFYSFSEPKFQVQLPEYQELKFLKLKSQGGLELSLPIDMSIALPYSPSFMVTNEHVFTQQVQLAADIFIDNPDAQVSVAKPLWMTIWESRWQQIMIISLYLVVLTWFFLNQEKLVKHTKFTHQFRAISLIFVTFYLGFYAQGQLSVVNIYTLLLSIYDGFNINMFLLDPILFILWVFVFVSLFLFGRGLFCGWLCPFGAMQEFMGWVAARLKIKQITIKPTHHKLGQSIKYFILVGLVGCSFYSVSLAESLAEIEPFKTAVTLQFLRYWPFVLYALLLLLLSLKIHKVYCRYLCPLGAGLAIVGRYPIFKWLRRRDECGNPCQLCRQKKCGIDAINKDGSIDYAECIQCLECVVTLDNPNLCKIDKYKKKPIKTRVQNIHPISVKP